MQFVLFDRGKQRLMHMQYIVVQLFIAYDMMFSYLWILVNKICSLLPGSNNGTQQK